MNRLYLVLASLVFLILLTASGCGGGGSSTNSSVQVAWPTRSRSVIDIDLSSALSVKIALSKTDGSDVASWTFNRDAGKPQAHTETYQLPKGLSPTLTRMKADFYAQANATGDLVGSATADVSISGDTIVLTKIVIDAVITSVTVPPTTLTLTETDVQLTFSAKDADDNTVAVDAGSAIWSIVTGNALLELTPDGLATPKNSGSPTVIATVDSVASSPTTIIIAGTDPLPPGVRGKWTVLVFMNAANDLYSFSTLNMNQMERVATNPEVRYVTQWKLSQDLFSSSPFDGTRRYISYPDTTPLGDPGDTIKSHLITDMGTGVDMGQADTLKEFVRWGKEQYPADHYVLVVWNHGNGWMRSVDDNPITRGVSYDDQTGNAIQIWQLQPALTGSGMDMIAFDASLMQMAEIAYELRGITPLVVGSEESPPGEGYPYQTVLKPFADTPDLTPAELSKSFVDGMLSVPAYATRKITQSVIATNKLNQVGTACSALGNLIFLHPEANDAVIAARLASQSYSPTTYRHYYDLMSFASNLKSRVTAADLKTACDDVIAAVGKAVLWEGHNAQSPGSRGIAIDLSTAAQFALVREDYIKLAWASGTAWDEWLRVAP